jgi:hypothetical protein
VKHSAVQWNYLPPSLVDAFEGDRDVVTDVETHARAATLRERKTIVFARQSDGRWLAEHEHLVACTVS